MQEIIIKEAKDNLPSVDQTLVTPSVISSEDIRLKAKNNMVKLNKLLNPYG